VSGNNRHGQYDFSGIEWRDFGGIAWKLGDLGQSCDAVCSSFAGLECSSSIFPQLSTADTLNRFRSAGHVCASSSSTSSSAAPYLSGGTCYRGVGTSSCSASGSTYGRLCPCHFSHLASRKIDLTRSSGHGAAAQIPAVAGGAGDMILLPGAVASSMCSITRYRAWSVLCLSRPCDDAEIESVRTRQQRPDRTSACLLYFQAYGRWLCWSGRPCLRTSRYFGGFKHITLLRRERSLDSRVRHGWLDRAG